MGTEQTLSPWPECQVLPFNSPFECTLRLDAEWHIPKRRRHRDRPWYVAFTLTFLSCLMSWGCWQVHRNVSPSRGQRGGGDAAFPEAEIRHYAKGLNIVSITKKAQCKWSLLVSLGTDSWSLRKPEVKHDISVVNSLDGFLIPPFRPVTMLAKEWIAFTGPL